MTNGLMYIPSLEEYAKIKKINSTYNALEILSCEECRYCRASLNVCIYGNNIRNLDNVTICPRLKIK